MEKCARCCAARHEHEKRNGLVPDHEFVEEETSAGSLPSVTYMLELSDEELLALQRRIMQGVLAPDEDQPLLWSVIGKIDAVREGR